MYNADIKFDMLMKVKGISFDLFLAKLRPQTRVCVVDGSELEGP